MNRIPRKTKTAPVKRNFTNYFLIVLIHLFFNSFFFNKQTFVAGEQKQQSGESSATNPGGQHESIENNDSATPHTYTMGALQDWSLTYRRVQSKPFKGAYLSEELDLTYNEEGTYSRKFTS
jgi:hypothetical protein